VVSGKDVTDVSHKKQIGLNGEVSKPPDQQLGLGSGQHVDLSQTTDVVPCGGKNTAVESFSELTQVRTCDTPAETHCTDACSEVPELSPTLGPDNGPPCRQRQSGE